MALVSVHFWQVGQRAQEQSLYLVMAVELQRLTKLHTITCRDLLAPTP